MEISFPCPDCGEPIEDDIENASYDFSAEKVSEGTGFAATTVVCECGEEYNIELTAGPTGKTVYVSDHPETNVMFEDDTYSDDDED